MFCTHIEVDTVGSKIGAYSVSIYKSLMIKYAWKWFPLVFWWSSLVYLCLWATGASWQAILTERLQYAPICIYWLSSDSDAHFCCTHCLTDLPGKREPDTASGIFFWATALQKFQYTEREAFHPLTCSLPQRSGFGTASVKVEPSYYHPYCLYCSQLLLLSLTVSIRFDYDY